MTGSFTARQFSFSIRREFWENRWLSLAPLAVAALYFIGFLVTARHLPDTLKASSAAHMKHAQSSLAVPYHMGAGLLMLTTMLIAGFYALDSLYSERRDRSILFWKSLPVSDTVAVAAKASIAIVLVPLLGLAVTIVLQACMLLVSIAVLGMSGVRASALWTELEFPRMTALLVYHWLTVHVLWEAPLYGWLFLVSAWARRAPLVWAVLPPFALGFLEQLVLGTSYFADFMNNRVSGGGAEAITMPGTFPMSPSTHATVGLFLTSPGLWIGLAFTAAFLAASIRLRQRGAAL